MNRTFTALGMALSSMLALGLGCEDEELVATGTREPPSCETDDQYCGISGRLDGGQPVLDAGVVVDAGFPDGGFPDGGFPDAGFPDGGFPDAGFPDAGFPDTGPPPPDFLNLIGTYDTEYLLDLSDGFFGIGNIGGPLDGIVQIRQSTQGAYAALEDWTNPILAFLLADALHNLAQNLIPDWLATIMSALNGIAQFLSSMTVYAELSITNQLATANINEQALTAQEVWEQVHIVVIEGCALGTFDPAYGGPGVLGCEDVVLNVVSPPAVAGPLDVEVDVRNPFFGVLQSGTPTAPFEFTDRAVGVELYKLVTIVIDLIVQAVSPYPNLQTALNSAVPCSQIAQDLSSDPAEQLLIQAGCISFVNGIVQQVINGINGIGIGYRFMDINPQRGVAADTQAPGDGNADVLQRLTPPSSSIGGEIRAFGSFGAGDLEGEWEGLRCNQPSPPSGC